MFVIVVIIVVVVVVVVVEIKKDEHFYLDVFQRNQVDAILLHWNGDCSAVVSPSIVFLFLHFFCFVLFLCFSFYL